MNKNTLKAVNKRIANGEKDFRIGDNHYHVNDNGAVFHYNDYMGSCPLLDGMIENGQLNPNKFI